MALMPTALSLEEVRALLAARVTEEGSQMKAATALGISQGHLNDMLHGRRAISDAVLKGLGLERTVTFFKTRSTSK